MVNNALVTLAALLWFFVAISINNSRNDDGREVIATRSGQLVVCSGGSCWVRLGDSSLIPVERCQPAAAVAGCRVGGSPLRDLFGY